MAKTNGKRNRDAGHQFEKDEVKKHSRFFKNLKTTRACNRSRDADGIDICIDDELKNGRLPLDISCKSSTNASIAYVKFLEKMKTDPSRIGVVLHRRTRKPLINKKTGLPGVNFITKGEYALMTRRSYELLLQHLYAIQKLRKMNPLLVEALEESLGFKLMDFSNQIV